MHKFSLTNRIKYAFDNFMARGFIALTSGLGLISLMVIFGASIIVVAGGWGPPDDSDFTFIEALWASLLRTLDPGTMGEDQGWGFRIIMLLVTLSGISIISTLIGVVNNAIETKLSELRKGRSVVIESGHTLILGWSPQIFTMVKELVISNEGRKNACIVILADHDKVEMEDELQEKAGNYKNTKVVCRSGDPIDIDDLAIVSPQTSRSIIILPPEGDNPDATTLKIILAIVQGKNRRQEPYHITAQIHDPRNMDVAAMVGKDEVELVQISDMISRLIAQTCRQSGLSIVYSELLGYDGDEIYFQAEPSLSGKTYGELLDKYIDSAVIGIMPDKGQPVLNPPMNTVFGPKDQVIAISENFDTVRLSPPTQDMIDRSTLVQVVEAAPTPESTLILGWNWRAPAIINELDNYVAPGSMVLLISDEPEAERIIAHSCRNLNHQRIDCMLADTTSREILDEIDVISFKHIIILSYSDRLDPQEADSVSMITLLHLRDITRKLDYPISIVSEMLDQRNRALIEIAQADDYIVSNHFISLVVTQISQNKHLNTVFKDLFDADGSEIYLKLATNYIKPGVPVNFYTVTEAARAKGQTAIGYHLKSVPQTRDNLFGITINPIKSAMITFEEWDRIIVVAED